MRDWGRMSFYPRSLYAYPPRNPRRLLVSVGPFPAYTISSRITPAVIAAKAEIPDDLSAAPPERECSKETTNRSQSVSNRTNNMVDKRGFLPVLCSGASQSALTTAYVPRVSRKKLLPRVAETFRMETSRNNSRMEALERISEEKDQ